MALIVHEITTAGPNVVCVEVRDPPIVHGQIIELGSATAEDYGQWYLDGSTRQRPIGPDKTHARTADIRSTEYLDRDAAESLDGSGYSFSGGYTVTAVYVKSRPYQNGFVSGDTATAGATKAMSSAHELYIVLDGNLVEGSYTIGFPAGTTIPDQDFTFDDHETRCKGIRWTQVGCRPDDEWKCAIFGMKLPSGPDRGDVTLSGGYLNFEVIDSRGVALFSGTMTQRLAIGSSEHGIGIGGGIIRYDDPYLPLDITGITNANPGEVSYTLPSGGSHPSNGDVIRIREIYSGMTNARDNTYTVANVDTINGTFELSGVDTTAWPTYTSGGKVFHTYEANAAGCTTYSADFSSLTDAPPGMYRIRIPGLGVSDPFLMDDHVWYDVYVNCMKGLYHHRAGAECDGRYGYTRPLCLHPDVITFRETRCSIGFSSANGGPVNQFTEASSEPYIGDVITGWHGGHMDAGDWDTRMVGVSLVLMGLLHGLEDAPTELRDAQWGLPKATEVLDPVLYAGTDDIGDAYQEIFWALDTHRRTQWANGAVYGGMELSGGPQILEPSHLTRILPHVYWPDPQSAWAYAACAAMLARHLSDMGYSSLSSVWQTSAVNAWIWAELINGDATERDNHFAVLKANLSTTDYDDGIENALNPIHRKAASAALHRLTGDHATYGTVFLAVSTTRTNQANWEYVKANHGNEDTDEQGTIRNAFFFDAGNWYNMAIGANDATNGARTYDRLKFMGLLPNFGQGGFAWTDAAHTNVSVTLDAYYQNPREDAAKGMQGGFHHMLGANQLGLCFATGLGTRTTRYVLHEDSFAMGVDPPAGIFSYGWGTFTGGTYVLNFDGNEYSLINDNTDRTDDFIQQKKIKPHRWCVPHLEFNFENRYMIGNNEYTVQQSMYPQAHAALALAGRRSNTAMQPQVRRLRFTATTS